MPLYSNIFPDMPGHKLHTGSNRWLALLAIGYLAVGAPLIHPLLHDHHGHPRDHGIASRVTIHTAGVDAIEHECLICKFLGQNHALLFNRPPLVAANLPTDFGLGGYPVLYVHLSTNPVSPRGPPLGLSPSIA